MIYSRQPEKPDLSTIDGMARDFLSRADLTQPGFIEFKNFHHSALHEFHHGTGMAIRNYYGLWVDHPLTEQWRTDEKSRDIRNGIDYSEGHPDSVSMAVLSRIHTLAQDL